VDRFENEVVGSFSQDVGVFYSFDSHVGVKKNGRDVARAGYAFDGVWRGVAEPAAHRNAAINLARTSIQYRIPFGAVTRSDLERLSDWEVIVIPNA
jgi:hypothetical protein